MKSLDEFWMRLTSKREFKSSPRIVVAAKGVTYSTPERQQIFGLAAGIEFAARDGRLPAVHHPRSQLKGTR